MLNHFNKFLENRVGIIFEDSDNEYIKDGEIINKGFLQLRVGMDNFFIGLIYLFHRIYKILNGHLLFWYIKTTYPCFYVLSYVY